MGVEKMHKLMPDSMPLGHWKPPHAPASLWGLSRCSSAGGAVGTEREVAPGASGKLVPPFAVASS